MKHSGEKRSARTRKALIDAFNCLVVCSNQGKIRVSDIVQRADVGRSTFYDHFSGVDEVLREAMSAPLSILADAVVGKTNDQKLVGLLEHFQANQKRAIEIFADCSKRDQLTILLAELIESHSNDLRANGETKLVNRQLAESAMALIRVWINNEVKCDEAAIATAIVRTSALLRNGLTLPTTDSRDADTSSIDNQPEDHSAC